MAVAGAFVQLVDGLTVAVAEMEAAGCSATSDVAAECFAPGVFSDTWNPLLYLRFCKKLAETTLVDVLQALSISEKIKTAKRP